ncbi:hypothetical protein KAS45_06710 [candidate division WOR-3 bacterium]|nr:hypothetical protein [candidate division WOR-3 bacterium]
MKNSRKTSTNDAPPMRLQDNRVAIQRLYNDGNATTRRLIQKSITGIRVNGKNDGLLIAEISDDGIIEIISDRTGRIVPWSYLTDSERWSFWRYLNRLFMTVEGIDR